MESLALHVLPLRYSSWSMRAWLALKHAGLAFETRTVELPSVGHQRPGSAAPSEADELALRRGKGSVTGLFPVLWAGSRAVHEALAICELAAEWAPEAQLWPQDLISRAQARAACCEMASGFHQIRGDMSCHVFARVPDFTLRAETQREVLRVFELWRGMLDQHGGPFLAGEFGIPDCMYYPVLTRFRTYGVPVPGDLEAYAARLESCEPVRALIEVAAKAPRLPVYDQYIRELGGDPDAAL